MSSNNVDRYYCTFSTQIRKKRNRVYQDGIIHVDINQKKVSVFDDRNMFIDSYMFLEMSTDSLKKLEGESLMLEKCCVDVLEPWKNFNETQNVSLEGEVSNSPANVAEKLQGKSPIKVPLKKKRKAPLVRMVRPIQSIYVGVNNQSFNSNDLPRNLNVEVISANSILSNGQASTHKESMKAKLRKDNSRKLTNDMATIDNTNIIVEKPIEYKDPLTLQKVSGHNSTDNSTLNSLSQWKKQKINQEIPKDIPRERFHGRQIDIQSNPVRRSDDMLLSILEDEMEDSCSNSNKASYYSQNFNLPTNSNSEILGSNALVENHTNNYPIRSNDQIHKSIHTPNREKYSTSFFDDILQEENIEEPVENEEVFEIDFSHEIETKNEQPKTSASNFKVNIRSRMFESVVVNRTHHDSIYENEESELENLNQLEHNTSTKSERVVNTSNINVKESNIKSKHIQHSADNIQLSHDKSTFGNQKLNERKEINSQEDVFDVNVPIAAVEEDHFILRPKSRSLKSQVDIHAPESVATPNQILTLPTKRKRQESGESNPQNEDDMILRPKKLKKSPNRSPPQTVNVVRNTKQFSSPFVSPQVLLHNSGIPSQSFNNVLKYISSKSSTMSRLLFPESDILGCNFERQCLIPDKFSSAKEYFDVYQSALFEEMNLQLFQLAHKFRYAYNQISDSSSKEAQAPSCKKCSRKTVLRTVKKQNQNQGRLFYSCTTKDCNFFVSWVDQSNTVKDGGLRITDPKERMSYFRKAGVPYYFDCQLIKSSKRSRENPQFFIILEGKEKASNYAMDDIWIISYSESFRMDNTFIAKSLYHAPGADGFLEIEILYGTPKPISKAESIFAIRGPNFSLETQLVKNLDTMNIHNFPLLRNLLGDFTDNLQNTPTFRVDPDRIRLKVDETIKNYSLNEDQATVLRRCAKWFSKDDNSENIALVHGAFGAGKSFLLTVIIIFICELMDEFGDTSTKILISSVTNVAVDNILRRLINMGFENVLRVGSQQKIAKDILPYTLSMDKSKNAMIKELKQMLKEDLSEIDMNGVKRRINDLQSGKQEERESQLNQFRVVGVTCAASSFEVLNSCTFPIIIQDESSQCIEPLALLPISRFNCQKLIAVGDPQQLPPTLVGSSNTLENSIEKTLFVRLMHAGIQPIKLRTQYRCHPKIAKISNMMFYENSLIDGIEEEERSAIVGSLPPVAIVDTINGKEQSYGDSYYNESEIVVIANMIQKMIELYNIVPEQIGVISLYKPQVYKFTEYLKKQSLRKVKVSTVDAFQGGEKDIIFLTCVRTEGNSNQFLDNEKRLNVAFTRAKRHLIVVGKKSLLIKSHLWKGFIEYVEKIGEMKTNAQILASDDIR